MVFVLVIYMKHDFWSIYATIPKMYREREILQQISFSFNIIVFIHVWNIFFSNISSFHIRAFWIIWLKLVKISFKSDFRILLRVKASKRKLKDDWLLTISWITQTKHILRGIFCGSDKKLYFFTIIQPLWVKVLRLLSQASKMSLLMLTLKSYE